MKIILAIYVIMFLITYVLCKIQRDKEGENEWVDVTFTLLYSLTSPVMLWIILYYIIKEYMDSNNIKPPKWL